MRRAGRLRHAEQGDAAERAEKKRRHLQSAHNERKMCAQTPPPSDWFTKKSDLDGGQTHGVLFSELSTPSTPIGVLQYVYVLSFLYIFKNLM